MRVAKDFDGDRIQVSNEIVANLKVTNSSIGPSKTSSFYLLTDYIIRDERGDIASPIPYDGVYVSDLGGLVNGTWTCPESGLYKILTTGLIEFVETAAPFFQAVSIGNNGTQPELFMGWERGPASPIYSGTLPFIVFLNAGATLNVSVFQKSTIPGTPAKCPAGKQTFIVEKVIANNVSAFYTTLYTHVPQNTPTVIEYDGVYSSSLGGLVNGVWTCPETGTYKVSMCGAMRMATDSVCTMTVSFRDMPLLTLSWYGASNDGAEFSSGGVGAIVQIGKDDLLTVTATQNNVQDGLVIPFYQTFSIEKL